MTEQLGVKQRRLQFHIVYIYKHYSVIQVAKHKSGGGVRIQARSLVLLMMPLDMKIFADVGKAISMLFGTLTSYSPEKKGEQERKK